MKNENTNSEVVRDLPILTASNVLLAPSHFKCFYKYATHEEINMLPKINSVRNEERGFSLTEILVALGLIAVISTVLVAVLMNTNKVSQSSAVSAMTQQELLDATSRVTKEIAAAHKFVSADDNHVTFQSDRAQKNEEITFFAWNHQDPASEIVDVDNSLLPAESDAIMEVRVNLANPDEKTVTTLVSGLHIDKTNPKPVFEYFDKTNTDPMDTKVAEESLKDIQRVSLRFSAFADGRDVPMELVTSITPRVILGYMNDTPNVFGETSEDDAPPTEITEIVLTGTLPARTTTATLSWNDMPDAVNYALTRTDITTGAVTVVYSGILPTFVDSSLTRGHTYTYSVTGTDMLNVTSTSNTVTLVASPAAPVIKVTASGLTNTVSWSPVVGASGYKVYRVGTTTALATVTTTSYAHANTSASASALPYYGQTNSYYVVAQNSKGATSEDSNIAAAVSPPKAPVATGSHSDGVRTVTYASVANATKYELKRTAPSVYTWSGDASYRGGYDSSVIDSATFSYQARAGNDAGWGPWSNVVTLSPRPSAPVLTGSHSNGVRTATYAAVANATQYQLQRVTPTSKVWDGNASYRGGSDGESIDSPTFTYRARAYNISGWSEWSNTVTLSPRPGAVTVTGKDYGDGFDGRNQVNWNGVTNATYYQWSRNWDTGWNPTTATSVTDSSPAADSSYNYYVRACNITGCGGNAYVNLKQAPGAFSINSMSQTRRANFDETRGKTFEAYSLERDTASATVAWTASSGADSYELNSNGDQSGRSYSWVPTSGKYYTLTAKAKGNTSGYTRTDSYKFWSAPATVSKFVITPQTASTGLNTQFLYSSAEASWKELASDSGEGSYDIQRKAWSNDVVSGNWRFSSEFDFKNWSGAEVDTLNYTKADITGSRTSVGATAATRTVKSIPSGYSAGSFGSQRNSKFIPDGGIFSTGGNTSAVLWFTHATLNPAKWANVTHSSGWADIKYTSGNYPDGRTSGIGYVVVSK